MEILNIIILIIMYLCTSIIAGIVLKTLESNTTLRVIAFILGPISVTVLLIYTIGRAIKYIFE